MAEIVDESSPGGVFQSDTPTSVESQTGNDNIRLDDLEDVDTAGVTAGQTIIYSAVDNEWRPGDVGTSPSGPDDLSDLDDVDPTVPSQGQVLTFQGSTWGPVSLPSRILDLSDLGDVSTAGVASGDLLQYNAGAGEWQAVENQLSTLDDIDFSTPPGNDQVLAYNSMDGAFRPFDLSIDHLSNVDTSTPATNGQVLSYNTVDAEWIPTTLDSVPTSLSDLSDVDTSGASAGQYLTYDVNSGEWTPSALNSLNTVTITDSESPQGTTSLNSTSNDLRFQGTGGVEVFVSSGVVQIDGTNVAGGGGGGGTTTYAAGNTDSIDGTLGTGNLLTYDLNIDTTATADDEVILQVTSDGVSGTLNTSHVTVHSQVSDTMSTDQDVSLGGEFYVGSVYDVGYDAASGNLNISKVQPDGTQATTSTPIRLGTDFVYDSGLELDAGADQETVYPHNAQERLVVNVNLNTNYRFDEGPSLVWAFTEFDPAASLSASDFDIRFDNATNPTQIIALLPRYFAGTIQFTVDAITQNTNPNPAASPADGDGTSTRAERVSHTIGRHLPVFAIYQTTEPTATEFEATGLLNPPQDYVSGNEAHTITLPGVSGESSVWIAVPASVTQEFSFDTCIGYSEYVRASDEGSTTVNFPDYGLISNPSAGFDYTTYRFDLHPAEDVTFRGRDA